MSLKGEENPNLKPKELIFLLAMAGRIDAQGKLLAQKLDKDQYIYHAYAILDSLSCSYSMFKYFLEVYFASSDPELIRNIMTSPEGIAAITLEATFLVSFAFMASLFDKEEKDSTKKFIATAWPYFRDVMKGLKNAYKGWRSTVQVLSILSEADLKYMVLPVGLALGVFAAANRFWIRHMVENRKKQMDINKELLLVIQQLKTLTPVDREHYLNEIEYQDKEERVQAFLAVAAGGFIDGLYLYIGVVSLSVLSPPLFMALSAISAFYTLACVVSRIYEEYDFQLRLIITQTKCKLALATKEMETVHAKLLLLQEKKNKTDADLNEIKRLKSELCGLIANFENLRQLLKEQTTHNYLTAALLGMKYGLFAYGVFTSILFMVASVFLITATAFPPAVLSAFIVSGLVLMMGMMAFTLRSHYLHMQKQENKDEDHPYDQIKEMKKNIEAQEDEVEILSPNGFKESLRDGVAIDPSPQFFFQEWFEVFRSLASGISKGNNFSNFITTPFQEMDPDGHYHESPIMTILAMGNAILFSLVLGLRALARGLGRPAKGTNPEPIAKTVILESSMDKIETETVGESSEPDRKKSHDSLPRTQSFVSRLSFFGTKTTKSEIQPLVYSKSEIALSALNSQINDNIILGLE